MIFEQAGKENTQRTLELAVNTARERGISYLVLSSTEGYTAEQLPDTQGIQVVVVTTAYGSKAPNENRLSQEKRRQLEEKGYQVCTAGHALSGAERGLLGGAGFAAGLALAVLADRRLRRQGGAVGYRVIRKL